MKTPLHGSPGPAASRPPSGARSRESLRELALYEAVRAGSTRAFRSLLREHHAGMTRLVVRVAPGHDPLPILRAAWTTALGGLAMFAWHTTFRAWLYGILIAQARARARESGSGPPPPARRITAPVDGAVPTHVADLPWTVWWHAGSWDALEARVQRLPADQRAAVLLVDTEGWPAAEARDVLGRTAASLSGLLVGGRATLAAALAGELATGTASVVGGIPTLLRRLPDPPVAVPEAALMADFRRWRTGCGLRPWTHLLRRAALRGAAQRAADP